MTSDDAVRPTKAALAEAGIQIPDLGIELSDLEHPIVVKAQGVPLAARVGSAKRAVSLTDRVWFKAKVNDWRGLVADTSGETAMPWYERLAQLGEWWWIGTIGQRQGDSPQKDFWAVTKARAFAGGKNTCSTDFMLPVDWDIRRLEAESALLATRSIQRSIRKAAAESMRTNSIMGITIGTADVRVRVRMLEDGQVYIAVGATGIADPKFFALMFTSFVGLGAGDWLPEPGGAAGLECVPGEILYSAMMSQEAQANLLSET